MIPPIVRDYQSDVEAIHEFPWTLTQGSRVIRAFAYLDPRSHAAHLSEVLQGTLLVDNHDLALTNPRELDSVAWALQVLWALTRPEEHAHREHMLSFVSDADRRLEGLIQAVPEWASHLNGQMADIQTYLPAIRAGWHSTYHDLLAVETFFAVTRDTPVNYDEASALYRSASSAFLNGHSALFQTLALAELLQHSGVSAVDDPRLREFVIISNQPEEEGAALFRNTLTASVKRNTVRFVKQYRISLEAQPQ